jgi:hypothetical protein
MSFADPNVFYVQILKQKTGLALNAKIRHPSFITTKEGRAWMLKSEPGRVFGNGCRKAKARHADPDRFVFL